jgi:hypothetical protein
MDRSDDWRDPMTHLTREELLSWRDAPTDASREHIVGHLATCDECADAYAELIRTRPADVAASRLNSDRFIEAGYRAARGRHPAPIQQPRVPSRRPASWLLPLAAALILGLLTPFIYRATVLAPRPADTVRGTDVQPMAPIGPVQELREFSWQSPIEAAQYRVRVFRGTTEIWTATSTTTRLQSTLPLLERNVEYTWQVDAIDKEGAVRLQSPRQPFMLHR